MLGGISKYSMIQGIGEMGKPVGRPTKYSDDLQRQAATGNIGGCAFWMCAIANQALPS